MKKISIISDPRVDAKFAAYPKEIIPKLEYLRLLILTTAEGDGASTIEEALKWGEPSYLVKKGSTVRIDWKSKSPDQYAIYFKCTSKLVETFREIYGDLFRYEKNRAILFKLEDKVPETELRACITTALKYHSLKHLPLLGLKCREY